MNGSSGALAFVVLDAETPVESLNVTATSSDTLLIPSGNVVLARTPPRSRKRIRTFCREVP